MSMKSEVSEMLKQRKIKLGEAKFNKRFGDIAEAEWDSIKKGLNAKGKNFIKDIDDTKEFVKNKTIYGKKGAENLYKELRNDRINVKNKNISNYTDLEKSKNSHIYHDFKNVPFELNGETKTAKMRYMNHDFNNSKISMSKENKSYRQKTSFNQKTSSNSKAEKELLSKLQGNFPDIAKTAIGAGVGVGIFATVFGSNKGEQSNAQLYNQQQNQY